jgi:microspherule protein 1
MSLLSSAVQPMPRGEHVLNFSDAEDMINDEDLK